MSNRVLLGKRGSDYGLFVSKPTQDVTNAAVSTNLSFDSRALGSLYVAGEGSPLKGESSIAAPSGSPTADTISHSLGYIPAYAVRWCYASDLSSGVAVRMYNPSNIVCTKITYLPYYQTEQDTATGGVHCIMTASNLTIVNYEFGINHSTGSGIADVAAQFIYYAYLIFQIPDFTDGFSL